MKFKMCLSTNKFSYRGVNIFLFFSFQLIIQYIKLNPNYDPKTTPTRPKASQHAEQSTSLAQALGVTKFTNARAMILVILCCAT
jgi:hypothetical protein